MATQQTLRNPLKLSLLSSAILFALTAPMAVVAQETDNDPQEPVNTRQLEHITVTAEKTVSTIQETGMVLNSFSGEDLLEAGVSDVDGLVSLIPNVQLLEATGGGVPVVFIRGVGLADFRVNNSPAAAFYDDEIYKPSVAMMASSFYDLERIEVLKGPQGGLYGRNANAGAIQVISAKPSLAGNSGYLDFGIGEYAKVELEGAYNAVITDKLAMRISGRHVSSDNTYMHSVQPDGAGSFTRTGHGAQDEWATRVQFYYEANHKFNANLKIFGGENKSDFDLLRPIGIWEGSDTMVPGLADGALTNAVCSSLLAGYRDDSHCATITGQTVEELGLVGVHDSASSTINRLDNRSIGATLAMNYHTDNDIQLTSITHWESFDHARPNDWDAVGGSYQDIYYQTEISSFSQEFRLAYDFDNVRVLAGINYAKESLDEDSTIIGTQGIIPVGFGHTRVHQLYEQDVEALAIFGRADYSLTDQLSLITELRFTKEDKSFAGQTHLYGPVGGTDPNEGMLLVDATQPDASFDDVSGKVTLNYQANRDFLAYASLSRGFKSGGFPGGLVLSNEGAEKYDSETINGYEFGVKSDLLDRRLRLNASAFYYDYSNLQGSARVPAQGGVTLDRFQNIGDAEVYGFDLELTYLLSDNWLVQAMVGHAEGEITDSAATQLSPLTGEEFALEGKELNYKPDFSANLLVRHDFELSSGYGGFAQVMYDWRSSQNFTYIGNLAEQTVFTEGAYGKVNLQVGFSKFDSNWQFSLFVKNLTDTEYRTNARADDLGGAYEIYGAPRTWGIKANYQF